MKFIFIGILLIFFYSLFVEDEFLAGASFSPLLIILGIWFNE